MPPISLREGVPAVEPKKYVVGGLEVFTWSNDIDATKPLPFILIAHPRGLDYRYGQVIAQEIINQVPNAICTSFDLPNHGTRIVSKQSNQDWAHGNQTHAQDMLGVIDQASAEVELVAEYLPTYIAELGQAVAQKTAIPLVTGISLGGHISWKLAVGRLGCFGTQYVKGIAPIVGCPDTQQMLLDRYAIQVSGGGGLPSMPKNSYAERVNLIGTEYPVLALCGADDKLVPARYTEKWAKEGQLSANQKVYVQPNTGHVCTPEMIDMLCEWINGFIV